MTPASASPGNEPELRRAIGAQPDSAHAHAALASFLCDAGRADEALAHVDREARRRPSTIWPLSIKAGILSGERRTRDAIEVHRTLVAMAPGVPLLWANLAGDLAAAGDVAEAAAAYRQAVDLAPDLGAGWLGLANLRLAPPGDADMTAMEDALARVRDPHQKVQLLFALGRGYGERGAFDKSFGKYSQANTLRAELVPHDGTRLAAFVDAHRALPVPSHGQPNAFPGDGAIFIVGMPRSGSTLAEQVLASHPAIEALGELTALADVATAIGPFDAPEAFVRRLHSLTDADAEQLGRRYLGAAGRYRRTDRPFFTDKMPANWRLVPLIRRILPGARIIDVRRDPLACCFSAYTTYFNRHTAFPNSLEDLGRYYRCYVKMMTMVQDAMPDRVYRLDYHVMVSDTEGAVRSLLDFLQLPFATPCLSPHRNSRAIYTPSAQQVRAAIHGGQRRDRSQDYLPWLGPLQSALAS